MKGKNYNKGWNLKLAYPVLNVIQPAVFEKQFEFIQAFNSSLLCTESCVCQQLVYGFCAAWRKRSSLLIVNFSVKVLFKLLLLLLLWWSVPVEINHSGLPESKGGSKIIPFNTRGQCWEFCMEPTDDEEIWGGVWHRTPPWASQQTFTIVGSHDTKITKIFRFLDFSLHWNTIFFVNQTNYQSTAYKTIT